MDLHYFINKYEAIPEAMWCVRHRMNAQGQRCAHGHCYIGNPDAIFTVNEEEEALNKLSEKYASITGGYGFAVINNGAHKNYQQPSPKQRVLAAFYDMREEEKQREKIADEIITNAHESLVLLD